jgi:hypothetical protein
MIEEVGSGKEGWGAEGMGEVGWGGEGEVVIYASCILILRLAGGGGRGGGPYPASRACRSPRRGARGSSCRSSLHGGECQ